MGKMNTVSHMVLGAPILFACHKLLHINREFPQIPDMKPEDSRKGMKEAAGLVKESRRYQLALFCG